MTTPKKYRSIFISDCHLGTNVCQHEKLLEFLDSLETRNGYNVETLYLNGDIIDMTCMDYRLFFVKHREVLIKFLRMAAKGVKIIYIFGNHDYYGKEIFNHDFDIDFNGIQFEERVIHTGLDGKRYLVLHGDQFDGVVGIHPWLYSVGDWFYTLLTKFNKFQNRIRRLFNKPEWSLSLWIKTKTKDAIKFITNFETLITQEAVKEKADGIICGHIHQLKDEYINGVRYLNSGCVTEFASFVCELSNGTIKALMMDDVISKSQKGKQK